MTPKETATELINTFGDLASEVCDEVLINVTSLPNIANHYLEVKRLIRYNQNKEDDTDKAIDCMICMASKKIVSHNIMS